MLRHCAASLRGSLQHLLDAVVEVLLELLRDICTSVLIVLLRPTPSFGSPLRLHVRVHRVHLLHGLHLLLLVRRARGLQGLHLLQHARLHQMLQLGAHLHLVACRDSEHLAHRMHLLGELQRGHRGRRVHAWRASPLRRQSRHRGAHLRLHARLRHELLPHERVQAIMGARRDEAPGRHCGGPCGLLARLLGRHGRRHRLPCVANPCLREELLERLLLLDMGHCWGGNRSLGGGRSADLLLPLLHWRLQRSCPAIHPGQAVLAQDPCARRRGADGQRVILHDLGSDPCCNVASLMNNALLARGADDGALRGLPELVAPLLFV
mmetsp:Transcript_12018/g.31805  ORF Transcript_12018/g.31805 Transcript_12018/m.31805 type:complete len:322 (-) Transcript_12018:1082-2047(-)